VTVGSCIECFVVCVLFVGTGGACSCCDMWCEGAWFGSVVLDRCVLCLDVASYVWPNVCSEWLQVVSGRVLCEGGRTYVGHCVRRLFRVELYCT